ncbi:serine hydrolase [Enterococcus massiliensis]|uniref:serine hydrolase n=1 Tax=Enterococcus massiliensis TaxID=1640685 RepID=UPI00065E9405|nr:serine hydrolase [Enterococcus massiliensis]
MKINWFFLPQYFAELVLLLFLIVPKAFTGGYIGFELLLTISGFFVASWIIDSFAKKPNKFFSDSIKKIVRLIGVLIGFVIILFPFASLINHDFLVDGYRQLAAIFGFVTNYYQIFHGITFADQGQFLFSQLWPVALGMQCFLVTLLFLLIYTKRNNGQMTKKKIRKVLFIFAFPLAVISYLFMGQGTASGMAHAELLLSSFRHAFPFFSGIVTATLSGGRVPSQRFLEKSPKISQLTISLRVVLVAIILFSTSIIFSLSSPYFYMTAGFTTILSSYFLYSVKLLVTKMKYEDKWLVFDEKNGLFFLFYWSFYILLVSKLFWGIAMILAGVLAGGILWFYMESKAVFSNRESFLGRLKIDTQKLIKVIFSIGIILMIATGVSVAKAPKISTRVEEKLSANLVTSEKNMEKMQIAGDKILSEKLTQSWQQQVADYTGSVDVAIYSADRKQSYYFSTAKGETFYSASIIKVAILVELLHQKETQNSELTAEEQALAKQMIEYSDNDSASSLLLNELGGYNGLDSLFKGLEMDNSKSDSTAWGTTTTTAADQMKLLNTIYYDSEYLSEKHQTYIKELMANVDETQQWGISAGGSQFQLKDGWLPLDNEWTVNSIGHVYQEDNPQGYTIAILTKGNKTEAAGKEIIEKLATSANELLFQ